MIKVTVSMLCILLSALGLALIRNPSTAQVQSSDELRLDFKTNGFHGTYKTQGKEYSFETSHPSHDFFLTRILQPDGSVLAESLRNNNILTVKLPQVQVTFDTSKKSPTQQSEEVKAKILEFMQSNDATVIRKLFAAIVEEKDRVLKSQLKGFTAIVMVIGDEPGGLKIGNDVRELFFKQKGIQGNFSSANALNAPTPLLRQDPECLGCCGPGCWGCTG